MQSGEISSEPVERKRSDSDEEPRQRDNEFHRLEKIKNKKRQSIIEKQREPEQADVDFEELELIFLGNKNRVRVMILGTMKTYLHWLTLRHHVPRKPYHYLPAIIMVLLTLDVAYQAALFYLTSNNQFSFFGHSEDLLYLLLELFLPLPLSSVLALGMGLLCVDSFY